MNARFLFKSAFLKLAFPLVILALAALAAPERGSAQVLYGSIVGNVKDSTGATVPDAVVSIVQVETKRARQATTNEAGGYTFATIPSGTYILKVSKEGFSPFTENQVPVTINSVTRVDVTLKIGSVSQAVEVTAETALLQTDRSEVRAELTGMELRELPVPVRNYQSMFRMIPGFSVPTNEHSVPSNPSRALRYNVNGTSASSNNVRIDGASSYNIWLPHITAYVPPMEAIETVNVVTNSFDAEQGLAGGSAINVQIKSGTNNLHGSAFEYHTNEKLRTQNYFAPPGTQKGKWRYNQYGGTWGGPVVRNRLFYFVSYEGTRDRQFLSRTVSVPTESMRRGDLGASPTPIYDPLTGNANGSGRTPFANNIIPADRIDPVAARLIALIPLPNVRNADGSIPGTDNYFAQAPFVLNRWTVDSKMNWNATDKLNLFGRFSILDFFTENGTVFGQQLQGQAMGTSNPGTGEGNTYNVSAGATYTLSSNLLMDAHVGFVRMKTGVAQSDINERKGLEWLGLPGTNGPHSYEGGTPFFDLDTYADLGTVDTFMPYYRKDDQYQTVLNVNWVKGRHDIRFGTDIYYQALNHTQPEISGGTSMGARGGFRFRSGPTQILGGPTGNQYNAFGAFLLGLPTLDGRLKLVEPYATRMREYSLYVRDQWQPLSKLTIS